MGVGLKYLLLLAILLGAAFSIYPEKQHVVTSSLVTSPANQPNQAILPGALPKSDPLAITGSMGDAPCGGQVPNNRRSKNQPPAVWAGPPVAGEQKDRQLPSPHARPLAQNGQAVPLGESRKVAGSAQVPACNQEPASHLGASNKTEPLFSKARLDEEDPQNGATLKWLNNPTPPAPNVKRRRQRTKFIIHVARRGDTFWSLARHYYHDSRQLKRIRRANPHINPKKIRIGMRIRIPLPVYSPVDTPSKIIHIVKPGDTMYNLAVKYYHDHTRWIEIQKANPRVDPMRLQKGKRLYIPYPLR